MSIAMIVVGVVLGIVLLALAAYCWSNRCTRCGWRLGDPLNEVCQTCRQNDEGDEYQ